VNPGEFNISTNPTATYRERIIYDINNDGVFDEVDMDLLLRYYNKYKNIVKTQTIDDNGLILEQDTLNDESWWSNDILITESEDVLLLTTYINQTQTSDQIFTELNSEILNYLYDLDSRGLLDINGDGITDMSDAKILIKYFNQQRGYDLVNQNLTKNSSRNTAGLILEFLDSMTGKLIGKELLSDFSNFVESSSLDRTGSYLAPYITTIGLYSGLELVAVAKLGQPIKNPINYPINFLVRIDT
jgi:hypothetical protein